MAIVFLSRTDDYALMDSAQDCRRWAVPDRAGNALDTVADLLINTDTELVKTIALDLGAHISRSAVDLRREVVIVLRGSGSQYGECVTTVVTVNEEA